MCPDTRPPAAQDPDRLATRWTPALLLCLLVFFCLLAFVVFRAPYELWDESRYVNNAMEMVLSHHWLVLRYDGATDPWITEPPVLIWIFAGLLKLGVRLPYAIRLPSLAAGALVPATLFLVADRVLHRRFVAFTATLLLLSSVLFLGPHVVWNGDFDALLCLWITVGALSLWAYFEDVAGLGNGWIALSAAMLFAGILTKGFAGVQLLPAYFVYALISPPARRKLADWRLWVSLGLALVACALYYIARQHVDPGYWQRVERNEIFGRLGSTIEGHVGGPLFYLKRMVAFFEPCTLLCLLLLPGSFRRDRAKRTLSSSLAWFCLVVAGVTLLLLSLSRTKLPYYIVNTLPLLSLYAAIGLGDLLHRRAERRSNASASTPVRPAFGAAWVLALLMLCVAANLGFAARRVNHRRRSPDLLRFVNDRGVLRAAEMHRQPVVILEQDIPGTPFSPQYRPYGQLVKNEAALQGYDQVAIVDNAATLPVAALLISCDQALYAPLVQQRRVAIDRQDRTGCMAGTVVPAPTASLP